MKTIHVKLIVTVVLMVAVFAAAGQPARGNKNVKKENTGVVRKSETGPKNARSTVDTRKVREINRSAQGREIRRVEPNYRASATPARVKVPNHFQGNRHYRYVPSYGHTIKNFNKKPVVFHSGSSKFYFHNNHFYRYHNGVGYIWVENPYGMVFPKLPKGSVLVHIGGRPYFQYGDVYFVHHRVGYEVISLPARYYKARPVIHISASF